MERKTDFKDASIAASQSLKEKDYWLNRLAGDFENVTLGVPYDYETGNTGKRSLEEITSRFHPEIFAGLKKISKEAHPKIYMILTAALQVLIYKYTGTNDIMVCAPIYKQKIEADFINTVLILRNQPDANMTFKDLLIRVRDSILEAVENQNYPIKNLLYDINPSLFNENRFLVGIVILLENIHDPQYIRDVLFDSCFSFRIIEDSLELSLRYNSSRFERTTMERMIEHYDILLKETLSEVNARLGEINILSGEERNRLLYDFNRTEAEYPANQSIPGLFAGQVEKTPGSIAVADEKNQLSYGELNKRSDGLANVLREKGVRFDTIVAVMAEPSPQLPEAILGVLKAGGAYLPIDPTYPEERINFMLRDCKVNYLVKKSNNFSNSNFGEGKNVIFIDDVSLYFSSPPAFHPHLSPVPGSCLAYVIYTSGSIGVSRGVLIEHRSILNYIYWRIAFYKITAADVSLQLVSPAFDGFCANLYPGLLTGGRTVFLNLAKGWDAVYTRTVISREAVTHFSVVPSIYGMLLEGADVSGFDSLRFVALAGEKAAERVIETSQRLLPRVQLINEYGPTENSVATTANRGITPGNTAVIGTPIFNNRVFILDQNQCIVPIGAVGELCVSGSGLARGYLNNPELTSQKFLTVSSGYYRSYMSHVYKTGDLAKWLADGRIQISGRIDHQVQVRGGRIEPEEIETHLRKHHDIKQAVVVAKKDKQGDTYLCAYVVLSNGGKSTGANPNVPAEDGTYMKVTQYKAFLSRQLPDFMVPARFVQLEKIPLTGNGKIDRRVLTGWELTTGAETQYMPPRDEIEKKLVEMWEKLLDTEKVGIRDNFFNIGGDSIKVISLLNAINKEFGANFKAVDLYENETIEKTAITINKTRTAQPDQSLEQAEEEIDEIKNRFLEGI